MSELPFRTVAVLGLGVIGGSLARALRATAPDVKVVGWSPALGERDLALRERAVLAAPSAWEEAVEEADLVVLAAPLEACRRILPDLDGLAPPNATIMDVASLKEPMFRAAAQAGLLHRWVGAHPMAGSEGSGFPHASADLFDGARVWLVAAAEAEERVVGVRALWRLVGGEPQVIGAEAHDRMMGLVSHLPQLVATALAVGMSRRGVDLDTLGPGGRDMTRLAASNPAVWLDLFQHAPPELPDALRALAEIVIEEASALERGDVELLERLMREGGTWRKEG